jgi:RNA polymerase sigma-70 factor (ECF subfamily)
VTAADHVFAETVREHGARLTWMARRLCGNTADADDLVHDTYERALHAWGQLGDRSRARSWLVAILHHLFIDRCRKIVREFPTDAEELESLELPDAGASGGPPPWADITCQQIDTALASLDIEFRRAYELHVLGRSYQEIAAELNIALATVGTRLTRARRKLKTALMRELSGEPGPHTALRESTRRG